MSFSLRAISALDIFYLKFPEFSIKYSIKFPVNFSFLDIHNSGIFYEKEQPLGFFFQEIPGIFVLQNNKNSGIFWRKKIDPIRILDNFWLKIVWSRC